MIFWLEYTTYTFGESFALMLKKKILDKQDSAPTEVRRDDVDTISSLCL